MTADVRVRFTAEEVAEVLAAMQAVQNKARQTGRAAAGGIVDFSGALGGLKGLLAQIGGIVSAGVFINLVRQAADGAEASQKLSRELGTTAAKIAALRVEAKLADTDLQTLAPLIVRISALIDQAAAGSGKAGAFKALGLDPQVLKNLDAVDRFYAVSKAIQNTADGPQKLTAVYALLGKQTHQDLLILQEFTSKLEEVNQRVPGALALYSPTAIANAARMNDQFKDTSVVISGLATQFTSGFAAKIHDSLQQVNRDLTAGATGWREFGKIAGQALGSIALLIDELVDEVYTFGKALDSALKAKAAHPDAGGIEGLRIAMKAYNEEWEKGYKQRHDAREETFKNLFGPDAKPQQGPAAPTPGLKTPVDLEAVFQKQASLERAKIDQQIAMIRAAAKLRGDIEDQAYESGIQSVEDYYAHRRAIIQGAIDDEIAQLQKQIQYERASNPDQADAAKTIQALNARIALLRLQGQGEDLKLTADLKKAILDLGSTAIEDEIKIRQLQGKDHQARLAEIEQEIAAERLRPGVALEPGADERISKKREALILEADYQEAVRQGEVALAQMNAAEAQIRDRADAGLKSQLQSEKDILEVQKNSLPVLRARSDELVRAAVQTGNAEQIAKAQAFADQVHQIELNVRKVDDVLGQLEATGIDAATSAIEGFLANGATQWKSWGDAGRAAAYSIASALNALVSRMLAVALMQKVIGLFTGGAGSAGSALALPKIPLAGADYGIPGKAEGGILRGAGTGTSDSNIGIGPRGKVIRWADQEYLMPAKRVTQRGARLFLDRFRARGMAAIGDYISDNPAFMNAGPGYTVSTRAAALRTPIDVPSRMPDYGPPMQIPNFLGEMHREYLKSLAGAEPRETSGTMGGVLEVHHDESLIVKQVERFMESNKGRDIQIKTVAKNRRKFNRALGG